MKKDNNRNYHPALSLSILNLYATDVLVRGENDGLVLVNVVVVDCFDIPMILEFLSVVLCFSLGRYCLRSCC